MNDQKLNANSTIVVFQYNNQVRNFDEWIKLDSYSFFQSF